MAILIAGIAGFAWANSILNAAAVRSAAECMGYPFSGSPECPAILATISTYAMYQWMFLIVAVLGIILLILGAVLMPELPPTAVPYMPAPAPPPVPAAGTMPPPGAAAPVYGPPQPAGPPVYPCPRCGHRLVWAYDYDRWHCDNCGAWV